ncbi:MAG: DUF1836 domain-containing protein [Oscillospiraceae bacterium]|nr:DUF1836 domain-containing protein [Oscillospiraceae bacterium]
MYPRIKESLRETAAGFGLPTYHEIPNVGLYLEQTAKYISEYLAPLQDGGITTSMISNYVKKGLVANPVKKQYSREQIAYLLFIALAKSVMSMESIGQLLALQKQTYTAERAYEYFRREFVNVLQHTVGCKDELETVGEEGSGEKLLLREVIVTAVHKICLDLTFAQLRQTEQEEAKE